MSRGAAKRQFDYSWSLYQKGLRGESLESKVKQFARDEHLPKVFVPAMHCIAALVRDNASVSQEDALKGMLLAIEFSPTSKGLQHHVIRSCAYRAGLTTSPRSGVSHAIVDKGKELLRVKNFRSSATRPTFRRSLPQHADNCRTRKAAKENDDSRSIPPTTDRKRRRLITVLRNLTPEMKTKLKQEKAKEKELDRPDFIWHFILQSFSTMGNSRGYRGLILDKENYSKVTFGVLSRLGRNDRLERLNRVFSTASLRMAARKAEWASMNYDLIIAMGGLGKVRQAALSQQGTQAKIAFMKKFHGIGDKYARNIWMDVYHPDFRNSIAVDERIKKISSGLGYSFSNYRDHEDFYLEIAKEAGLEGWELDRLMYNFQSYLLNSL